MSKNYYKHDLNSTCSNPNINNNVVGGQVLFKDVKQGIDKTINRPQFNKFINDVISINNEQETLKVFNALNSDKNRTGINRVIERPQFYKGMVYPRRGYDFNGMEKLNIQQNGIKVQLGQQTLNELFRTEINDPNDTTYAAEGRAQRKITVYKNIADATLSVSEKITMLKTIILTQPNLNLTAIDDILTVVKDFLNIQKIGNMTQVDLDMLSESLKLMKYSKTWMDLPVAPLQRFMTLNEYLTLGASSSINLLLLNPYNPPNPLRQINKTVRYLQIPRGPPRGPYNIVANLNEIYIDIIDTINLLSQHADEVNPDKRLVLDLEDRAIIPLAYALDILNNNRMTYINETIDQEYLRVVAVPVSRSSSVPVSSSSSVPVSSSSSVPVPIAPPLITPPITPILLTKAQLIAQQKLDAEAYAQQKLAEAIQNGQTFTSGGNQNKFLASKRTEYINNNPI